jgi:uncharacterized protein (TIGR02145 family)
LIGQFITTSRTTAPFEWVDTGVDDDGSLRETYWSTAHTDGSGICPNGFRVPTSTELELEVNAMVGGATDNAYYYVFDGFLKLPTASVRMMQSGGMSTPFVSLWTTTVVDSNATYIFIYDTVDVRNSYNSHGTGSSVRCIQD